MGHHIAGRCDVATPPRAPVPAAKLDTGSPRVASTISGPTLRTSFPCGAELELCVAPLWGGLRDYDHITYPAKKPHTGPRVSPRTPRSKPRAFGRPLPHKGSKRAKGPLIDHNASNFTLSLLDSELYGNSANYPNPGMPARKGLFGSADRLDQRAPGRLPRASAAPSQCPEDRGAAGAPTKEEIVACLAREGGNVSRVAKGLGLHRNVVYRLFWEYGIKREETGP